MKYKVLRAFLLAGVRQEVGSEIELGSRDLIGGLKSFGKIAAVDPQPEPIGPMTTDNSGLVAGAVTKSAAKAATKD